MVESTRLESERTGNRTVGSNPTLSAIPSLIQLPLQMPVFNLRASLDLDDRKAARGYQVSTREPWNNK